MLINGNYPQYRKCKKHNQEFWMGEKVFLLKTIFFKVDLEISNNPKIRGFLPIFFVNKTDQILSQFQFSKGITIFLILFA